MWRWQYRYAVQVNLKTEETVGLLNSLSGGLKAFAILKLTQGFIDLSEGVSSLQPCYRIDLSTLGRSRLSNMFT